MLFHVPLPVSPVPHMCSVVFLRVLVTGMYCFVSSGAALYRPVCSLGLAGGPSFCTASPLLTLGLFCSIALLSSPRNRSIELRNVSVHSSIHPASIHQVPVRCQALGRDRHAFTELQPGGGGLRDTRRKYPDRRSPKGDAQDTQECDLASRQAYSPLTP